MPRIAFLVRSFMGAPQRVRCWWQEGSRGRGVANGGLVRLATRGRLVSALGRRSIRSERLLGRVQTIRTSCSATPARSILTATAAPAPAAVRIGRSVIAKRECRQTLREGAHHLNMRRANCNSVVLAITNCPGWRDGKRVTPVIRHEHRAILNRVSDVRNIGPGPWITILLSACRDCNKCHCRRECHCRCCALHCHHLATFDPGHNDEPDRAVPPPDTLIRRQSHSHRLMPGCRYIGSKRRSPSDRPRNPSLPLCVRPPRSL